MMRRWNKMLLSGAACAMLLGSGVLSVGFQSGAPDLVPVEAVHIVKPRETLWSICETFHEKDIGRETYLMEFRDEVIAANPWLTERHGQLQPGDTLHIVYYEKKPASAATDTDI